MDSTPQHEDLLIKLRAKLNEEKIKLWESPYFQTGSDISESLQGLAKKYSTELSLSGDAVLQGLRELQVHSVDRSKANAEFRETGYATFRVRATIPGDKARTIRVQKKLDVLGSDLIDTVANDVGVAETRVKLIYNGKVIKPTATLEQQGVTNGVQIMALIMAESAEESSAQDARVRELRRTREDAALLATRTDDLADDDEDMELEDQSGQPLQLPAGERAALLVGLALHERGRAAARARDHALALALLLEADDCLSACSSSLLSSVDNWAVLQLDIAWSYLCLQALSAARDAAARLQRAERAFQRSYGENQERLIALKGPAANERVLLMRLHLLQGIVNYHQNRRADASILLAKARAELDALRVDDTSLAALMELGWSSGQARRGLRAAGGDVDRAHLMLCDVSTARAVQRERGRALRQQRLLGVCADGSVVSSALVSTLENLGYSRGRAVKAVRAANNNEEEAVRMLKEHPELLTETESSEEESLSTSETVVDEKLVAKLEAMGYDTADITLALRHSHNDADKAVDLLLAGGSLHKSAEDGGNPSTSAGGSSRKRNRKAGIKRERERALRRLRSAIQTNDDAHLETSLSDEEEYLALYLSLL